MNDLEFKKFEMLFDCLVTMIKNQETIIELLKEINESKIEEV